MKLKIVIYWGTGIQQKPYKETAKNREIRKKYLEILDVFIVPDTAGWIGGYTAPLTAPSAPALNILHTPQYTFSQEEID